MKWSNNDYEVDQMIYFKAVSGVRSSTVKWKNPKVLRKEVFEAKLKEVPFDEPVQRLEEDSWWNDACSKLRRQQLSGSQFADAKSISKTVGTAKGKWGDESSQDGAWPKRLQSKSYEHEQEGKTKNDWIPLRGESEEKTIR